MRKPFIILLPLLNNRNNRILADASSVHRLFLNKENLYIEGQNLNLLLGGDCFLLSFDSKMK